MEPRKNGVREIKDVTEGKNTTLDFSRGGDAVRKVDDNSNC